jgi:diaminohydroxyphosphoribosylaminopyrimidine deaminase/5-amino-6-(5-phosphoribosylamino)uracil reductase
MTKDEIWMQRALDLALLGDGHVAPNPLVGCVIVHDDQLIGEGYHAQYGGPHAEVNAFQSLKQSAKGATVYVTLEPCSHFGKTPPCADLLIREQVGRVIICNLDPNPLVAGKGIERLMQAGITVDTGILATKGAQINHKFFHFYEKSRPWITLKFAESADGFIARENGEPVAFSNKVSQQLVHKLRTQHQAILIGVNTANADNPKLDARFWPGNSPIRMVVDPKNRMRRDIQLLQDEAPLLVFTCDFNFSEGNKQWIALGDNLLKGIMEYGSLHGIQSILVEGGTHTLEAFYQAGLADEMIKIKSVVYLEKGIKSPFKGLLWELMEQVGSDNSWLQVKENLAQ